MTRTITPVLSPLNPLAFSAILTQVDPTTGEESPLGSGSLTGFISIGSDYTAVALAGAGALAGAYSGADGAWTITKPAGDSTEGGILNAAFTGSAAATPYAVMTHSNGRRFYVQLEYQAGVAAIITT